MRHGGWRGDGVGEILLGDFGELLFGVGWRQPYAGDVRRGSMVMSEDTGE